MAAEDQGARSGLRQALVESLIRSGDIVTDSVADAFREVDRHLFTRATDVSESYANRSIATIRNEDGEALTTVSAPWLQARMLESAHLSAGMSVLEIGSGGYNASLISHVVGPAGKVYSVDIDDRVIGYATEALAEAQSGKPADNIELRVTDAWDENFDLDTEVDAVIVTVDAWTIPPIVWRRLRRGGHLVIPLRPFGLPLTIPFRRQSWSGMESTEAMWSGFVSGRGLGCRPSSGVLVSSSEEGILFDAEGGFVDGQWLGAMLKREPQICSSGVSLPAGHPLGDFLVWMLAGAHKVGALRTHDGRRSQAFPWLSPQGTPVWITSTGLVTLAFHKSRSSEAFELFIYAYGEGVEEGVARMTSRARQWSASGQTEPPVFQIEHDAQGPASAPDSPVIFRGDDRMLLS